MRDTDLEKRILNCAMRRDDKRAIPLIVYASEMVSYGFDMQYVIDCMEKNYDGRKLNTYGVIDNGI